MDFIHTYDQAHTSNVFRMFTVITLLFNESDVVIYDKTPVPLRRSLDVL